MKTTDFKPLPRPDFMEQSISGEPVITKEQRRFRAAILKWIKRLVTRDETK